MDKVSSKEKNYIWIPNLCPCERNKKCKFDENLWNCTCIKNDFVKLVITIDKTVSLTKTVSVNSIYGMIHCLIRLIISTIICLLLLLLN